MSQGPDETRTTRLHTGSVAPADPEARSGNTTIDLLPNVGGGSATAAGNRQDVRRGPEPIARELPRRFGAYELLEELGRGGMGVVYKARQIEANRLVALKVVRPDQLAAFLPDQQAAALARFHHEMEAAARIEHDHVIGVYDVGQCEGQAYYAMRYVDGESLAHVLRAGPLEPKAAARYMEQVARALAEAHRLGILHRDVKPHNVMLDRKTDRALLADFGLAKLAESDQQMTATASMLGSPPYMSPEQARDSARVTTSSDVYGLGATLYHLLTGRPPFQAASTLETLAQLLDRDPISPRALNPAVPLDLATICLKCLEKEPVRRYRSAQEVAEELGRFLRGEPILARPLNAPARAWRWSRRRPVVASLGASLLMAVVVGLTAFAMEFQRAERNWSQAEANLAASQRHAQSAQLAANNANQESARAKHAETAARAEAERARLAQHASDQAQQATEQALYYSRIALADQHLKDGDPVPAEHLLDQCPIELRHFEWHYLKRLCRKGRTQLGFNATEARFSGDGRRLILRHRNGQLATFEVKSWQRLATWPLGTGPLAVSYNGTHLALVDTKHLLKLWDIDTGEVVSSLGELPGTVTSLAFSRDGQQLAVARGENEVLVFDLKSGLVSATLDLNTHVPRQVEWSADGQFLYLLLNGTAPARFDNVCIWNVATQKQTRILHKAWLIDAFSFSADGRCFAVSGNSFLDCFEDNGHNVHRIAGSRGDHITRCQVSADGKLMAGLAPFTAAGTCIVVDADTGRRQFRYPGGVSTLGPDGRSLVVATGNSFVIDLAAPDAIWSSKASGNFAFTSDGRFIASGSGLLDAETGELLVSFSGTPITDGRVAIDRGKIGSTPTEEIRLRETKTGRLIQKLPGCGSPRVNSFTPTVSNNGAMLVAAYNDGIRLWNLTSTQVLKSWPNMVAGGMLFSPDERLLVSDQRELLRFWRLKDFAEQESIQVPIGTDRSAASRMAFDPTGKIIAWGGARGRPVVRLYDVSSRTLLHELHGHENRIAALDFSPDARRLVSAGGDGTLRVWDPHSGDAVLTIPISITYGASAKFSPDGRTIASADESPVAWLWGDPMPPLLNGATHDLIKLVDSAHDPVLGIWNTKQGRLYSPLGQRHDRVCIPIEPQGSYVLSLGFTRTASRVNRTVGVILPVGGGRTMLSFDHDGRRTAGLDMVRQQGVGDARHNNPTNINPGALEDGHRYDLKIQVRLKSTNADIQVTLDGKPYLHWWGPQLELSMWPDWELPGARGLGIAKGEVELEIDRLDLELLDAPAIALREGIVPRRIPDGISEIPAGEPIDLLSTVDPRADASDGLVVTAQEQSLALTPSTDNLPSRLSVPIWPRGSYRLEGSFALESLDAGFALVIPTGNTRCDADLLAFVPKKSVAGIAMIRGMSVDQATNPTRVSPARLVAGQEHRFAIETRLQGDEVSIQVELDGEPYFSWAGPQEDLSLWSGWEVPHRKTFAVGLRGSPATLHELKLTMLDGVAWLLAPPNGKATGSTPNAAR